MRLAADAEPLCWLAVADALRRGANLPEALDLGAQVLPEGARREVQALAREIGSGAPPVAAAAQRVGVFSAAALAALDAGLRSGELATALERHARDATTARTTARRLRLATAYPTAVSAAACGVAALAGAWALPRLVALGAQLDVVAPAWGMATLAVALALPLAALLGALWLRRRGLDPERRGGVGELLRGLQLAAACDQVAGLVEREVGLEEAFAVAAGGAGSGPLGDAFARIAAGLGAGEPLAAVVEAQRELDADARRALIDGARADRVAEALRAVAEHRRAALEIELPARLRAQAVAATALAGAAVAAVCVAWWATSLYFYPSGV